MFVLHTYIILCDTQLHYEFPCRDIGMFLSSHFIESTLESNQRLIEESDKGVINDFDEQLIKDCRKCAVNRLKVAQKCQNNRNGVSLRNHKSNQI